MEKFTPGDVVNLVRSKGIQLLFTVNKKICWKIERYIVLNFFPNSIWFESGVRLHVVKDYWMKFYQFHSTNKFESF